MNSIFKNNLVKTLLFIIVFLFINYLLNNFYISNQDDAYTQNITELKMFKPTIIAMGDSHTKFGFNPQYIDDSYNFATNSENFALTLYKYKWLKKQNLLPKTIVLQLDLHSFTGNRKFDLKPILYWRNFVDFKHFFLNSEDKVFSLVKILSAKYFTYSDNVEYFLSFGEDIEEEEKYTNLYKGYFKKKGDLSKLGDKEQTGKAVSRVNNHFSTDNKNQKNIALDAFIELLQLSKQDNVDVVLVKYPVSKDYFNLSSKKLDISKYEKLVYDNCKSCKIIDFRKIAFNKNYLLNDNDHLNNKGARVFSEMLSKELN